MALVNCKSQGRFRSEIFSTLSGHEIAKKGLLLGGLKTPLEIQEVGGRPPPDWNILVTGSGSANGLDNKVVPYSAGFRELQ